MSGVNMVILLGHLGKDPETRYLANGDAVTNVSIATSESWTDKSSGQKQEKTEWHRLTFYRRLAEVAGEYLKKGSQVYIEGKITYGKYTDKEGVERYTSDIVVRRMQLLGGRRDGGNQEASSRRSSSATERPSQPAQQPTDTFTDDDIPF